MKVELLNYTPNPEELIAKAGKLCYSSVGVEEIQEKLTEGEIEKFVSHLIDLGHESPLEHISFSFAIEGISRSLSHQLVRHRIASFSQQSQRYVKMDSPDFIVPLALEGESNKEAYDVYSKCLNVIQESYSKLIDLGVEKQDARYLLPNATPTKLIVTMNARTLLNFFELRCCARAETEIRMLANKMLLLVKEIAPTIFSKAGATCVRGYCKEGDMTCGKLDRMINR